MLFAIVVVGCDSRNGTRFRDDFACGPKKLVMGRPSSSALHVWHDWYFGNACPWKRRFYSRGN
jgi:hypothetical protein